MLLTGSMNIGITVYPTYGGCGIVGSELGKELAARGHTVHFVYCYFSSTSPCFIHGAFNLRASPAV